MRIVIDDVELNVAATERPGAPWVLCLHSLATDLGVWDQLVEDLAPLRSVLRLDLRGHGASAASPPPYDLARLVADAVAVLDDRGLDQVDVVGLSIGGMVAMGIALEHPERVRRVVVADARADAPDAFVQVMETGIADVAAGRLPEVVRGSTERWFSDDFRARHPEAVQALVERASRTSVDGYIGCARAVQGVSYLSQLERMTVPALFVAGELDPPSPPDVMRAMAERTPGGRFELIDGAAHLTPLETPDRFAEIVAAFLAEDGSA